MRRIAAGGQQLPACPRLDLRLLVVAVVVAVWVKVEAFQPAATKSAAFRQRQECGFSWFQGGGRYRSRARVLGTAAPSPKCATLEGGNEVLSSSPPLPGLPSPSESELESSPSPSSSTVVDLFARTWHSLDLGAVLEALSEECSTSKGREMCLQPDFRCSVEDVKELYAHVEELQLLGPGGVRLGSSMNIEGLLEVAVRGSSLECGELVEISETLTALNRLKKHLSTGEVEVGFGGEMVQVPALSRLVKPIKMDENLLNLLDGAFDDLGELSGKKFPNLREMREGIARLQSRVRSAIQQLLTSGEFKGMLADEGGGAAVSEINGRFVLPVKPTYKRTIGIVHSASRTGKTLFVEPSAIVGPSNELSELRIQLKLEEARILRRMTDLVVANHDSILTAIEAAARVDAANARVQVGEKMRGIVPEVGNEAVVRLTTARHPVLVLRGIPAVGNDIRIDSDNQALVLTGPNAGGKTIVLKTLGLVTLMVRLGIPIPAEPGGRVDVFDPVLADIGDLQSVSGDLSTFSGHLMVCKAVMDASKPGSLVLMDEMGSGTDPAQGVALAQALLEALLDLGARIAITTHYLQLKELAAADERFRVAAMQFVDGRPTYRMISGAVGESYAIEVAERLDLPPDVVSRAKNLLDEGTRQVGELVKKLEQEKAEVESLQDALRGKTEELDLQKKELQLQLVRARREAAAEYAAKLEEREAALQSVFERIKQDPSLSVVGAGLHDIRALKYQVEGEVEEPDPDEESDVPIPLTANDKLAVGDNVMVLTRGIMQNEIGTVTKILKRGASVEVSFGGVASTTFGVGELALPSKDRIESAKKAHSQAKRTRGKTSKRVAQYLAEADGPSRKGKGRKNDFAQAGAGSSGGKTVYIRGAGNTLDLRGKNLNEAQGMCTQFFSRLIMEGRDVGFLLHGHGTGALKRGLREYLPKSAMVKSSGPADDSDGGDAFTMVVLK
jgi:DNA mismatch repair protein MutS2